MTICTGQSVRTAIKDNNKARESEIQRESENGVSSLRCVTCLSSSDDTTRDLYAHVRVSKVSTVSLRVPKSRYSRVGSEAHEAFYVSYGCVMLNREKRERRRWRGAKEETSRGSGPSLRWGLRRWGRRGKGPWERRGERGSWLLERCFSEPPVTQLPIPPHCPILRRSSDLLKQR